MPDWLPEDIASKYGRPYSGFMASGINFGPDDGEEIEEALNDSGVSVRWDSPDLESLFCEQT